MSGQTRHPRPHGLDNNAIGGRQFLYLRAGRTLEGQNFLALGIDHPDDVDAQVSQRLDCYVGSDEGGVTGRGEVVCVIPESIVVSTDRQLVEISLHGLQGLLHTPLALTLLETGETVGDDLPGRGALNS